MKATDISIERKYGPILDRIEHYRSLISSITFETIFEPLQLLVVGANEAEVKISSIDDIASWHKELSYSFVTKVNNIEDQILYLVDREDIYSASILLRHHMEQCGYIALAVEKFIEFNKNNNIEIIEKFIAKTFFGSPFSNSNKFRNLPEAFATIRTPKIIDFIGALDRFFEKCCEESKINNLFSKNYSVLNHFAHPSSLSSVVFIDSKRVEDGHELKFRYKQDALGDFGKYNTLRLLEQNVIAGYTSYFIFNSFEFKNNQIVQNMDTIKYCWDNIISVFQKSDTDEIL